mmetsp:Transcript_9562/g.21139  ORF Transcript_9562/g.21139 Transcript_9562/m.21139 type:complete len:460 (-) Transcript_9562:273-1652(-)
MLHCAVAIEEHHQGGMEGAGQGGRGLNARVRHHRIVPEVVVHPDPESLVLRHRVRHPVPNVALVPPLLLRHPVRQFTLVEVGLPPVAAPDRQILQGVLHGQPVHDDVVPLDESAVRAGVVRGGGVASVGVVGAPEPEVVADDVTGSHCDHSLCLHLREAVRPARPSEHIRQHPRVHSVPPIPAVPPLQQGTGLDRPGLQQHPGHPHPVHIPHRNHGLARSRDKDGKTQAEQDGVRVGHLNGFLKNVGPRTEDHMHPLLQLAVDGGGGVPLAGDKDLVKPHLSGGRPLHPHAIKPHSRDIQIVQPIPINSDIRLLRNSRGLRRSHHRDPPIRAAVVARGGIHPHEHHVPHPLEPAPHTRVPGEPLLLGAGGDLPLDYAVGHVAPAGEASGIAGLVLEQYQVGVHVDAAEGGSLGHGPEHAIGPPEPVVAGGTPKILRRPPKRIQGPNTELGVTLLAIHPL